ncbi:MAG: hypothetical protein HQM08_15850 [Candidatus Riflebacteria bacterium]|nr:hypothetical protein [Candidatus Riflebacteria bacterium]
MIRYPANHLEKVATMAFFYLFFLLSSLFVEPKLLAGNQNFPNSGLGSLEITVKPFQERFPFHHDTLLLQAVSSDGTELYEIHVLAEDLLVLREFGGYLRTADRTPHHFKKGMMYKFLLSWNKETTKFSVNDKEIRGFNTMVINGFGKRQPFLKLGNDPDFEISNVQFSNQSTVSVERADREFVQNSHAPNLGELMDSASQESYQGVAIHEFPSQTLRDKIKKYIDLLPPDAVQVIKHVVFVEKKRYPLPNWHGEAFPGRNAILLTENSMEDPSTFFHEAAHLFDFSRIPIKGHMESAEWEKLFMKDQIYQELKDSRKLHSGTVIAEGDANTPVEQLAYFVGIVYDLYFSPGSSGLKSFMAEPQNRAKLDFLMKEGFMRQEVYDRVAGGTR